MTNKTQNINYPDKQKILRCLGYLLMKNVLDPNLANCLFSESLEIQTNKSRRIVFEDIY
jgi:hypothetical protein